MATSSYQVERDAALTNLQVSNVASIGERVVAPTVVAGVIDSDTAVATSWVSGVQVYTATGTSLHERSVTWDGSQTLLINSEAAGSDPVVVTLPDSLRTVGRILYVVPTNYNVSTLILVAPQTGLINGIASLDYNIITDYSGYPLIMTSNGSTWTGFPPTWL